MKPILGKTTRRERARALGQEAMVILTLLLGLGVARADTTDFTGDFAAAFWTNSPPGLGSVYFASDTELVLSGPQPSLNGTPSTDPITYNGPLGNGLAVGGTVLFDWQYSSPGYSSSDSAYFVWEPEGGGSQNQVLLAQGGGTFGSPPQKSVQLPQGATFVFILFTDTPEGKDAGSLVITGFQFIDVPEPSTGALLAGMLACLGAARWRRSHRQAPSRR